MSREEAIDYLKHIKENYHWCYEEDALEMAIKALEQCEVWEGIHGQVVAPKGTFEKIWNDAEKEEQEPQTDVLDKIIDDIQTLRGCSCSCSDGIVDDVESIIDKYRK